MRNLFQFIGHILAVCSASGPKRLAYSFLHIVSIAIMAGCFYGVWYLANNGERFLQGAGCGGLIFSWIGIVLCALAGILFLLQGFVAQLVTFVMGLIGLGKEGERLSNLFAALVALASIVALVVAGVVLLS